MSDARSACPHGHRTTLILLVQSLFYNLLNINVTTITYNLSDNKVTATLAPYTFESQGSQVVKVSLTVRRYSARAAAKITDAQIIGYVQSEFSRQRGGWGLYPEAADCVVTRIA